jgi:hypothetical protein
VHNAYYWNLSIHLKLDLVFHIILGIHYMTWFKDLLVLNPYLSHMQNRFDKWQKQPLQYIIMRNLVRRNHVTLQLKLKKNLVYNCYATIPWILQLLWNYPLGIWCINK